MTTLIKQYFIYAALITLVSCQSADTDHNEPAENNNSQALVTVTPQYRQEVIINHQLRMTIEQGNTEKLPSFFPTIDYEFSHYFAYNGVFYLHTDQFVQWRYFGNSRITEIFDEGKTGELSDNFDITTTLSEYPLSYTISYRLDGINTGTWQANIAGEDFSGRFVYERYHLKGENPALPRNIEQGTITSGITGVTYDYYAFIPKDYAENANDYPLLFATDGQWHRYPFHDIMSSMTPDVFLIALSQGPQNRRRVDFTLNGIDKYAEFIEFELIPFLEQKFRLKSDNRTIVGSSLGGLMVSSMLYKEMTRVNNGQSRLFHNFISLDGAYRLNTDIYTRQADEVFSSGLTFPSKLYLAGATDGLGHDVEQYYQSLRARNIQGLIIAQETFDFGHVPMKLPSMEHALEFIYPEQVYPNQ